MASMTASTASITVLRWAPRRPFRPLRRRRALEAMDYTLASKESLDTLEVEAEAAVMQSLALEQGINFYYPSEGSVRCRSTR